MIMRIGRAAAGILDLGNQGADAIGAGKPQGPEAGGHQILLEPLFREQIRAGRGGRQAAGVGAHEEESLWFQHPGDLAEHGPIVGNVLQNVQREGEFDRGGINRHGGGVGEVQLGPEPRAVGERVFRDIDPEATCVGELPGRPGEPNPTSAPHVQESLRGGFPETGEQKALLEVDHAKRPPVLTFNGLEALVVFGGKNDGGVGHVQTLPAPKTLR